MTTSPTAARAKALNAAASLAIGGADVATSRASEALDLHRQLGDDWGVAGSLYSSCGVGARST
jgi:hypothetical protein